MDSNTLPALWMRWHWLRSCRTRENSQGALEIAECGLGLEGAKAPLANWTTELAMALGETTRAQAAAEIALKEEPDAGGLPAGAGTGGQRLASPTVTSCSPTCAACRAICREQ